MTEPRTPQTLRGRRLGGAVALALMLALTPAASAQSSGPTRADLARATQAIGVPSGNRLILRSIGAGVQIYSWNGTAWTLVAPESTLFSYETVVALNIAGPTWLSVDGSSVLGATAVSNTPDPTAIPWLLVRAVSHQGRGRFSRVSFIQRLDTVGGLAPTEPGTFIGQEVRSPYIARYYFYQAVR